ncbi:prolyl aminopeptidase [Rhodobacter lacus]|uniref:Proline iminopeptidase n=1 Tax=Rhodobacter lacus TaxID=1641972 RepID=A0ABW5ABS6_9RHOB
MTPVLRPLFPEITPHRCGRLRVSDLHEIHFEECGNPAGQPVLILHGGPGAGIAPFLRRSHDPAQYRIVLADQRGAGQSTPLGALEENTTADLVADIEALRLHLGIARWQIVGGSWGSTLALAYGLAHPERVSGMILRGIFTGRQVEVDWFYQQGAGMILPEAFARYRATIPVAEQGAMIAAYHRRLTGPAGPVRRAAAQAWAGWEEAALRLIPCPSTPDDPAQIDAVARIECHYFANGCFFPTDGWLLDQIRAAAALRAVPCHIIQGRYDLITPAQTAFELARVWPEARLTLVPDAGHSGTEPGIADAMVRASTALSDQDPRQDGSNLPPSPLSTEEPNA